MEDYVLKIENLNKRYKNTVALDNISFHVGKNEIVGFIGPNGAGKSTTMKCICNLAIPDSGTIEVCGYDVKSQRKKALEVQSALIETPGLFVDMTGRENINLVGKIRNINKERIEEVYEFTELRDDLDRNVTEYSMGMKQRLALGIAILSKPKLLILDEPTNGLDPTGIIHLRDTLERLVETEDMSILFSSHQLGEVEKLADRIIAINNGKIVDMAGELEDINRFTIEVSETARIEDVLKNGESYKILSETSLRLNISKEKELNKILEALIKEDIRIIDINKEVIDTESIYKEVYKDSL